MKKLLALAIVATVSAGAAMADPVIHLQQRAYGSGTPSIPGTQGTPVVVYTQSSTALPDGLFYVPQYLPGYPTAAVIFPRVIDVNCIQKDGGPVKCEGYNWMPELGRGEYLLVRPNVKVINTPAPKVVKKPRG